MKSWLEQLEAKDRISFVTLVALCLLLFVVPFYLGGSRFEGQSFLFLLAGPIAYFAWRSNAKAFTHALVQPVSVLFFLLLCVMTLSLIPSADKFGTFINVLHWIAFYVVFISARVVVDSPQRFKFLSGAAVLSATILSVIGIYGVVTLTDFSDLRLVSTFGEHNAFGGFLILPLPLLIGHFIESQKTIHRMIWGVVLGIVGSAFILTFSRGSWLSFLVGVTVAAIISRKRVGEFIRNSKVLFGTIGVVLITTLVVTGSLYLTAQNAATKNQTVGVFNNGETLGANALTARLHYFEDALTVTKHNVLLGVGLRHYGEAVKLYKDTPAFYASGPHNEYLQLFAEIGIFGGLLFVLLVLLIFLHVFRFVRSVDSSFGWVTRSALFAGVTAVLLNLNMEVMWGYAASPLYFFTFVGATYGSFSLSDSSETSVQTLWKRVAVLAVLIVAGLTSIIGAGYWYQSQHMEAGLVRVTEKKYVEAFAEFKEANRFGDFDSSPHYYVATVLEYESQFISDPVLKKQALERALSEIQRSIELKPEKPLFYSWQALIYKDLGDENGYQKALEMTIRYNPVEGIYEYDQLAVLYNHQKEYEKVISLAEGVLPYYPLDMYANPYWVNPDKKTVWKQVADIYVQLGIAYAKKGNPTAAKEAQAHAKQYDPSIVP